MVYQQNNNIAVANVSEKQSRTRTIINYILTLVLILYSGNPYFIYSEKIRESFMVLTVLAFIIALGNIRIRILTHYFKYILPLLCIFAYHLSFIPTASFSSIMFMMMKMFVGVTIVCYVGKEFPKIYVNIITLTAAISLPLFVYNLFGGFLPGVQIGRITTSIIVYTQLLETPRNCGMFWEPGAFQAFLNLALIMMLQLEQKRHLLLRAIIIVIAILTTVSTTGYIVLMVIGAYFLYSRKTKSRLLNFIFLVAFVSMSVYVYRTEDFLGEKVEESLYGDNMDTGRIADFTMNSRLLMEHPFFGISYTDKVESGNGFFYQLVAVGIIGTLYIFGFLFFKIKKQTTTRFSLFFLLCVILLYQGEVLGTHPLFMALPFILFTHEKDRIICYKEENN